MTPSPHHSIAVRRIVLAVIGLCLASCAAGPHGHLSPDTGEVLFDGDLQELAPHHAGDLRVLRIQGHPLGDGVFVEHYKPGEQAHEFTVHSYKGRTPAAIQVIRTDGGTLSLVREVVLYQGAAFSFDPPLPVISVPLRAGPRRGRSAVMVRRFTDGEVLAAGHVDYVLSAQRVESPADHGQFEVVIEHALQLPGGNVRQRTRSRLLPGVGETAIHSVNESDGTTTTVELLCANIGGRPVGECDESVRTAIDEASEAAE